jgi:CheY-like chemotaxis protein
MSNAFKFTHGGTITLSVKDAKTEAFPAIIFSISDTGIGIGEQDLTALFEAFEQGENHQTRRFGGAGIGLAITRRLARLMGGDCWAESIVGQGSTFYLLIPNDHRKDAADEQQLLVDHNGDGREGGGKTVLVIEDDDDSLQLMRRWLGQMGFNVLAANDSRIGLESATTDHPDLVLVDALMPGISGYELLRQLRANSHTASIPVVVITVDDDPTRGLAAGASDYLRKPIMKSELRALVELYCGKVSGEVLIIDDDDAAADLIGRSVREIGFASRHATNGLEGLAMARESRPKAIVLDLTMPELDGFGVLDRLHADSGLREVPLIVLSGRRISVEEHRHLVASGHRYFVKGASTPRQIAQSLKELVA